MAAFLVVLGSGALVAARLGAVWNGSESLPFGLYWRVAGPPYPVHSGDYVVVCPPASATRLALARGYLASSGSGRGCSPRSRPLLKRIYGVRGDRYAVRAFGVSVNGALVRNSAPLLRDDHGRTLWDGRSIEGRLGPNQLIVLSSYNPASYDSRYFGPVDERTVWMRVRPVLTSSFDGRF